MDPGFRSQQWPVLSSVLDCIFANTIPLCCINRLDVDEYRSTSIGPPHHHFVLTLSVLLHEEFHLLEDHRMIPVTEIWPSSVGVTPISKAALYAKVE